MSANQELPKAPYSKHPTFNAFITKALHVFAPLAKEYGLELVSIREYGNECSIQYSNDTTGLEIRYEMPKPPSVAIARMKKAGTIWGVAYGLCFLVEERCPNITIDDVWKPDQPRESFEGVLRRYAHVLGDHAVDLLQGDFTVFPALERHAQRQMKQLKSQQIESERKRRRKAKKK